MIYLPTDGPWRFEVNLKSRSITLCGGLRPFDLAVMTFTRWGMNGATPCFKNPEDHGWLTRAGVFAVPCPGREHHKEWFRLVDNPDARLIEHAPAMLLVLKMLTAGIARLEVNGALAEIAFDGLRYVVDGDWPKLVGSIGWAKARNAVAWAMERRGNG